MNARAVFNSKEPLHYSREAIELRLKAVDNAGSQPSMAQ